MAFDSLSLLKFHPPRYLCARCCAIISSAWELRTKTDEPAKCKVCRGVYTATEEFQPNQYARFLDEAGYGVNFSNKYEQAFKLATIAAQEPSHCSRMKVLLSAINASESFIHVTTFGISDMFTGFLKLASMRRRVRVIVGSCSKGPREELEQHGRDTPMLEALLFDQGLSNREVPHQKIIIVDGLLAFKGSANFTIDGWRKAEKGLESIEIVTDIDEVRKLNNSLFSPIWARRSPSEVIEMDTFPF